MKKPRAVKTFQPAPNPMDKFIRGPLEAKPTPKKEITVKDLLALIENDCPHPARKTRHELYLAPREGFPNRTICRACGKEWGGPKKEYRRLRKRKTNLYEGKYLLLYPIGDLWSGSFQVSELLYASREEAEAAASYEGLPAVILKVEEVLNSQTESE